MKRPFVWTFLLISFGLLLMKLKVWGVLWGIEIFLILSPVVLLFLRKRGGINRKEWGRTVIVSTIVFMALLRGITWDMTYEQHRNIISDMTVAKEELRGTGKINQISENEYGYSIELNQTKIAINGKIQRCGKLYLYISKPRSGQKNLIEEYNLGDKVYVKGIPENFESARNEGNFHEAKYAYGVGRLCKLQDPELTLIKKGSMLCQLFENLEDSIRNVFARYLSAEDMGIGLAMITGNKDYLDEEDEERFYGVGIGHILAISGVQCSIFGIFNSA